MPIPPWLVRSGPSDLAIYDIAVNLNRLDNTTIYLTDARHVGIMLREGRLTLRNHSALTRFVVESVDNDNIVLHSPDAGDDKAYIQVGNKGAFFANAPRDQAQKFQLQVTELGTELYLAEQRPAVFDDNHDVSVGKWQKGLSTIPLLVHTDVSKIWNVANGGGELQGSTNAGVQ